MQIVAIGGGNKEPVMRAAADYAPGTNVLIVPSACSTPTSYDKKVAACTAFFDKLDFPSVVLHELGETPTPTQVEHEFGRTGIIYTIGGNTPTLLDLMPQHGTDKAFQESAARGVVLAGTSAGALVPFSHIHSCPAKKPAEEIWDYTHLEGLGLLRAAATAHANQHDPTPDGLRPDSRLDHLTAHFPPDATIGFGIENGAALVVRGQESFVFAAVAGATVHIIQRNEEGIFATRADDPTYLTQCMNKLVLPNSAS